MGVRLQSRDGDGDGNEIINGCNDASAIVDAKKQEVIGRTRVSFAHQAGAKLERLLWDIS